VWEFGLQMGGGSPGTDLMRQRAAFFIVFDDFLRNIDEPRPL
jgi:hypothetical protein